MRQGINQATVRVFDPSELAPEEKERLLCALESFVNLGDGLQDLESFGRQNPEFFPILILDDATVSDTPLSQPCVRGTWFTPEGDKPIWTRVITWDAACHRLALFYRDTLQNACWPTVPNPSDAFTGQTFLILLGIDPPAGIGNWVGAFEEIHATYPAAEAMAPQFSRLQADWKTGTFEYTPDNDFQRAVYILFREGWRAKTCARCSRRFLAGKPRQVYCSTKCFDEVKRERGNDWWNKHGKRWRAKRAAKGAGAGSRRKSASHKRTAKGAK